ncbi:MAG TPA: sialidase family protein [Verrucomicrobiae bacterium]|nr:sialidase family protein [Verrucomicrobiae bacterium]
MNKNFPTTRTMNTKLTLVLSALTLTSSIDLAAEPGLVKSEFIFTNAPFPSCHASTLAETREGLVAAWFGGTRERNPDVGIWLSRDVNGQWTPPVEVANGISRVHTLKSVHMTDFSTNRFPCWNPVLFQPRAGPLMLFYKVGPRPSAWWGMKMTSEDDGKTWSKPHRLPEGIVGPIKDKPVQLANGDILSGSSDESRGRTVHFERSSDLGKTWEATPPVACDPDVGPIQPCILFHPDGRLQALGRTKVGKMFETWSADDGRTWSRITLTSLPNPDSGIDAVTLKDGRQLLVYNHNIRTGSKNKGRSPLNVAISNDGQTWFAALILEDDPNAPNGFPYPAVIQTSDGLVHITYTWERKRIKHVVIDPQKLKRRPIVNGIWPK